MRIDPDKPGCSLSCAARELGMRVLAWAGVFVLVPLFIAGGLTAVGL
jgi:hypothetical protein